MDEKEIEKILDFRTEIIGDYALEKELNSLEEDAVNYPRPRPQAWRAPMRETPICLDTPDLPCQHSCRQGRGPVITKAIYVRKLPNGRGYYAHPASFFFPFARIFCAAFTSRM